MRTRSLPLIALTLLGASLNGCHGVPTFPVPPRVVHSEFFAVTTDLGDPIEGVLPLLDSCYEDMCARWGFEPLRSPKRQVILFADESDFRLLEGAHDFPPSRTGKCAGFYCTRCDAMVTYFRPGKTAHHPFYEAVLAIVDGHSTERLAGVLAHEMNHQLLYDRTPDAGDLPPWLVEGVAELESVRVQKRLDGGFDAWAVDGHSAVRTTLACLNLAAYQLYGNRAFEDGDQVTWAQDRYDLHLAACLALDAGDSALLRRFVMQGPERLERFEAPLRRQALVLATKTLVRLLFDPHSRFGAARINVYEVLALLWNRPEWGTYSPATRNAWRTFAHELDEHVDAGTLDLPPQLDARRGWSESAVASQAKAHGAIQRLLLNLEVPAKIVDRWLDDLHPPVAPPSMSGRVLVLAHDGPQPAPGLRVRALPAADYEPASRGTWGLPAAVARWRSQRLRSGGEDASAPAAETTTDADGWYVFKDLPAGDYRLVVSSSEGAPVTGYALQRTGDLGRQLHVPRQQRILLRPVTPDGQPLLEAQALVCDGAGDRVEQTSRWRDDGTLEVTFAGREWIRVWVTAPGHRPAGSHMRRVSGPQPLDLGPVTVHPGGARIVGQVLDASGKPPSQTVLVAVRDPRTRLLFLAEVKDGEFLVDGLRAGRVRLELYCWQSADLSDAPTRLGPKSFHLERAPDGTAAITLELPEGAF